MKRTNIKFSTADMTQSETANNEALIEMAVTLVTLMNATVEDAVRRVINEKQEAEKVECDWYTRTECAQKLGISTQTLWRALKLGQLHFTTRRVGHKILYLKKDVNGFLEQQININL